MSRYFLQIAYKGTNYHGWQIQENAPSVQEEINKALSTLLQEEIMVLGCGRTDTGVHAKDFYAHFETEKTIDTEKLCYQVNGILSNDIACYKVFKVEGDCHARFSATERTYEYLITTQKNPFTQEQAYFFPKKLDINLMNEAAKLLIRKADFSCFSKSNTDTFTNDCDLTEAYWEERNGVLVFTVSANRFLRNMVRAIVGTLLEVGTKKNTPNQVEEIIASKNRSNAGTSVPAHGLYLTKIKYPNF